MKHVELEDDLAQYLALMDISTSHEQLDLLARHIELVLEANSRVNLTRITGLADAVRLHTADSLAVLPDVAAAPAGKLLDLGTGAGFPGLPLAICSERQVVLMDSVAKKVREVSAMVDVLGLTNRVSVFAGRAEALARAKPSEFAVVLARAVSELPALVELAAPLLVRDGRLICLKGTPEQNEVDRASQVGDVVGMRLDHQRTFDLPQGFGHRTVLSYRKVSEPRMKLPRREGLAQHSPLG